MAFFFVIWRLIRAIRFGLTDPEFRAILSIVGVVLLVGTLFYARFEEWSILDSFYFSVTTLATVGYGDFAPTTTETKLFTVAYIFIGLGLIAAFAQRLGRQIIESRPHQRRDEQIGPPDA